MGADGAVLAFEQRIESALVLLEFAMMCDVISAVTEFMVRVLLPSRAIGTRDVAPVEA
jgi:hypothetical protein